ncbi:phosphatidyl inositol N-acetylglucosaminyl transferase subunit C [Culex quinquefasciatus]|uniref:Phosphatidyl inositol N-acetylglucosaminyl transferase subunit C n=1 Tax=Culex quinquefasciatus TaxID=7176 RepID=B0WK03_CULQU|nr:phosphatidyl inositol N-acetylglucosaminyl transferase subunit C [Culex quinquefasciatus]|eukprot:XP_001849037.1 phosphatidyl inositol N-acetylglucosaminyl transferase subunit C [Culex quinquefasciatus]
MAPHQHQQRKPWRKNLYENADYEDNYTDPSFLQELKTNANLQTYTLPEAFLGATRLSQQISIVASFLIVFHYLYTDTLKPQSILGQAIFGTVAGYLIYAGRSLRLGTVIEDFKTAAAVLVFGYIFSPLLHTLTDSVSTDTIFSMTFLVLMLHLIFYDYGVPAVIVSKAISLNAAIFGAICLASRLSSPFHAFVLLEVAAVYFALGPILLAKIRSVPLLVATVAVCFYLLLQLSMTIFWTYVCVLAFVNGFCPLLFVRLQRHKNNIHGPWDEAIVSDFREENGSASSI